MGLSPLFSQKLKGYSWNWLRFYRLRTAHTQTDIRPSHLMPWLSVTWPINTSTNSISPFPLWQLTVTAMHHACKPPTRALWPIKKIENLCNFCSYDLQTLWLNFIKKKYFASYKSYRRIWFQCHLSPWAHFVNLESIITTIQKHIICTWRGCICLYNQRQLQWWKSNL